MTQKNTRDRFLPFLLVVAFLVLPGLAFAAGQQEQGGQATGDQTEAIDIAPSEYGEAPTLRERVEAGELPPVEERLPEDPMVLNVTGRYGGTMRDSIIGTSIGAFQAHHYDRLLNVNSNDEVVPNIAESYEVSEDFTTFTFTIREGIKWSDGEPYTADDVSFYFERILPNEDLLPTKPWNFGDITSYEQLDERTFRIVFGAPQPNFIRGVVTNFWTYQFTGYPPQLCEQYHIDFVDEEELTAEAREQGFDTWAQLFFARTQPYNVNRTRPTLEPWIVTQGFDDSNQSLVFERNPYYFKVDAEGNQLPYIDSKRFAMVQDSEVLKLQAIAGEMDLHTRHLSFADIGLLLQNAESGNYEVGRRVEVVAQRTVFYLNATSPDPMKAELFDNADYRIALSHGIDREKLSEILYFGESEPAQVGVGPGEPAHYPPLWNAYTEFDPEKANRLLDELGMDERDSDGFRLAPNGETFSMSIETTQGRAEPVELVIEDWQEHLDIRARLRVVSRELLDQRTTINSLHDVRAWQGGRLPFEANLTKEQRFDQGSWTHGAWQRYLDTDGEQGEQPPEGHPWLRAYELNQQINRATDRDRQIELLLEAQELAAENLWLIGTVTHPPDPYIVNENLRNVPESVRYLLLFSFNPEAFYFAE